MYQQSAESRPPAAAAVLQLERERQDSSIGKIEEMHHAVETQGMDHQGCTPYNLLLLERVYVIRECTCSTEIHNRLVDIQHHV